MSVVEFNSTLFDLIDEMMGIVDPSPVIQASYAMFKSSNPDTTVAVDAFWEVAKDRKAMIQAKDLEAMADVLRGVVPLPGMVDDVWEALSDDNRGIVSDYITVLFDLAEAVKANETSGDVKEAKDATLYSMYNTILHDFLKLLQNAGDQSIKKGLEKFESVMDAKGASNTMVYAVMLPVMELVLPKHSAFTSEAAILKICLPPSNPVALARKDVVKIGDALFPFDRSLPFSTILGSIASIEDEACREKVATYWHYLKLFTLCIKECPPEAMAMMNGVVRMVHGSLG